MGIMVPMMLGAGVQGCSGNPTITGITDTVYNYPCPTPDTDYVYQTSEVTLSGSIGSFLVRFEYSEDGGTGWTFAQESSSLSYTHTSVGCCAGCDGDSGQASCTFRCMMRAKIRKSDGTSCTAWTTGADTGVINGRSGKYLTCGA